MPSAVWTDGSQDAPIFGGPGGAPAIGGAPVRDRRAAFLERSNFKLSAVRGPWLVRAVATTYWHDFKIRQTTLAGCANFIDRREVRRQRHDAGRQPRDVATHAVYARAIGKHQHTKSIADVAATGDEHA